MPLAIDANVSGVQLTGSGTITSPAITTTSTNELLVAFITSNLASSTVSTVTGAGLTWTRQVRSNTQSTSGSAEIWTASTFGILTSQTITANSSSGSASMSIAVISFSDSDAASGKIGATATPSSASAAVSGSLVTTKDQSWVWAVVVYANNPETVTPGGSQTVYATLNDTFNTRTSWVQYNTALTTERGTSVTLNDSSPSDAVQWNMAMIEIRPRTSKIGVSNNLRPRAFAPGIAR